MKTLTTNALCFGDDISRLEFSPTADVTYRHFHLSWGHRFVVSAAMHYEASAVLHCVNANINLCALQAMLLFTTFQPITNLFRYSDKYHCEDSNRSFSGR